MQAKSASDWVSVTDSPLSSDALTTWVTRPDCGAVVTFSGTVRNSSTTGHEIQALEYETSVDLAEGRLGEVVREARRRWPDLVAVAVHHRSGRVALGDAAVVVAVSAPHRREAFEGAQFCIDTLKRSVPMWKRELWEGGGAWSSEAQPIEPVGEA